MKHECKKENCPECRMIAERRYANYRNGFKMGAANLALPPSPDVDKDLRDGFNDGYGAFSKAMKKKAIDFGLFTEEQIDVIEKTVICAECKRAITDPNDDYTDGKGARLHKKCYEKWTEK